MVLKLNREVTMPTGPPRRGLSIDVSAGRVSMGAPTLRPDNHHFGVKTVIYMVFFGDEIFILHVKLPFF